MSKLYMNLPWLRGAAPAGAQRMECILNLVMWRICAVINQFMWGKLSNLALVGDTKLRKNPVQ